MLELTSTKQWKDEPVVNYINRWRSLSLDYKDQLFKTSAIEIIANHGKKKPITDFNKDKVFTPKVDKTGKKPTTFIKTFFAPVKISSKNKLKEMKRS
ncbi:hypothetical protein PS2_000252 [Malus domestica]